MNKKIIYIFIIIALAIAGCYNNQNLVNNQQKQGAYNFASIYNPGASLINPDYKIYIESNNSAKFFFKFDNRDLLKLLDNYDSTKSITLEIKYVLRDIETMEISDSNTYNFNVNFKAGRMYSDSFNINIPSDNKYRLIVNFSVAQIKKYKRIVAFIDNSEKATENKFLVEAIDSVNEVNYKNFIDTSKSYLITSNFFNTVQIQYYKPSEYTLTPPYSSYSNTKKMQPDTIFEYKLGDTLKFSNTGFYVLKDVSQSEPGLCLLSTGSSFPEILTVGDMLEPLKLITANKEFAKIKSSDSIKLAIDEFWYSRSNNKSFAKEQIRVFYNRVRLANIYFSDNIEGWQTDRGMIYIILGPPSIIYLSDENEEWYYGENPDVAGLLFTFNKENNPYSTNSFILLRDNMYQPVWSQATSTWKKGRVFNI